jgi:hypothetical protein
MLQLNSWHDKVSKKFLVFVMMILIIDMKFLLCKRWNRLLMMMLNFAINLVVNNLSVFIILNNMLCFFFFQCPEIYVYVRENMKFIYKWRESWRAFLRFSFTSDYQIYIFIILHFTSHNVVFWLRFVISLLKFVIIFCLLIIDKG